MPRPSFLWLLADDLGTAELGFAPASDRRIRTPNIDALAVDGMQFTAAYAGYTVCAPSRATLFTGRNSGHIAGAPSDWPILPQLLREGGYRTAAFGKSAPMDGPVMIPETLAWGLPIHHGFETYAGQASQRLCHNMYPISYVAQNVSTPLPLNAKMKSRSLCMAHPDRFNYSTDLFADLACKWLRGHYTVPTTSVPWRPFFLYLAFTVPHAGGWGSAPDAPEQGNPVPTEMSYGEEGWPEVERDHAASISYLDTKIGSVLATLTELDLQQTTVVFFASDNGPHNEGGHDVHFFKSTGGLRGYKRSFYEGGTRSPSLVRWPGVVRPASISHTPWAFWDVLPTMLDIAGIPLPRGAHFDGRSILPALRGEEQPSPAYMYWTWRGELQEEVALPGNTSKQIGEDFFTSAQPSGYAVRMGEWKGVVHACADQKRMKPSIDDAMELYDLSADPFETQNIAALGYGPSIVKKIKLFLVERHLSCASWGV